MKYNELRQAIKQGIHYGIIPVSKVPNNKQECLELFTKYLVSDVKCTSLVHIPSNNKRYYYTVDVQISETKQLKFSFKTLGECYRFIKRCDCSVSNYATVWGYQNGELDRYYGSFKVFNTGAENGLRPYCLLRTVKSDITLDIENNSENKLKNEPKIKRLLSLPIDRNILKNAMAILKA